MPAVYAHEVRMERLSQTRRVEPRWPVMLAVLTVFLLLVLLPARIRAFPNWVLFAVACAGLAPTLGVTLSGADARWTRLERVVTLLFCLAVGTSTVISLGFLVRAMVSESAVASGLVLLSSGTAAWATNVIVFSLLYWQVDRGGPEARANDTGIWPDWLFPQVAATEDVPPGWRPAFVDYLALGFTTATAFSPTDVLPLTSRAKLLMMLESLISLITIVVVASRAINVLGS